VPSLPPEINPPRLGVPLSAEFSYVKRASSERQARSWNDTLALDPFHGPAATGLVVGVFPVRDEDGRFPLVWVPAPGPAST
jgi:hypothetical protein